MFPKRLACLTAAALCLFALTGSVFAAQTDCDSTYCFTSQDFSQAEDTLAGICITGLPDSKTGTVMLGNRVLRSGDILTAEQIARMTFMPLRTEIDTDAVLTYLPIYEGRVEASTTMTIAVIGKEDKAPVAEDSTLETYKNLPNEGALKAQDPEGQSLTYTLVRSPKRGTVTLREDGTFLYTPKKNKVGVDSFTFTATDPAGNVSRTATVTISILKPTDATQYTDTIGNHCRFAAEWMRNTGLFVGEQVAGETCFYPEKAVSQGEFLTMVVKLLDIPTEDIDAISIPDDAPQWLRPYLAAAIRSGLIAGIPDNETGSFGGSDPITGAQVAVMLQNALDLSVATDAAFTEDESVPAWAQTALAVMNNNGLALNANNPLTRADVATILYEANLLAVNAPGTTVLRMQK